MNNNPHKVVIDKDLEDLIPVFMGNRHKEVESLRTALAAADFDQLRHLGHRMKGVGNSYGFAQISLFGKQVEDGARGGDRASIATTITEYGDYLAKVQISYE